MSCERCASGCSAQSCSCDCGCADDRLELPGSAPGQSTLPVRLGDYGAPGPSTLPARLGDYGRFSSTAHGVWAIRSGRH